MAEQRNRATMALRTLAGFTVRRASDVVRSGSSRDGLCNAAAIAEGVGELRALRLRLRAGRVGGICLGVAERHECPEYFLCAIAWKGDVRASHSAWNAVATSEYRCEEDASSDGDA